MATQKQLKGRKLLSYQTVYKALPAISKENIYMYSFFLHKYKNKQQMLQQKAVDKIRRDICDMIFLVAKKKIHINATK